MRSTIDETLEEERAADEKLSELALAGLNQQAEGEDDDGDEDDDDEDKDEKPGAPGRRPARARATFWVKIRNSTWRQS